MSQTDGKILTVGSDALPTGPEHFVISRFNADGSPDVGFGATGGVTVSFGGFDNAHAVAVQPDGKIVVVGSNTRSFCPIASTLLAVTRLNPDGTLDTTFGTDGRVTFGSDAN